MMECDGEVAALCRSDVGACNGSRANIDLTHEEKTSEKSLKSDKTECPSLENCEKIEGEAMHDDVPQTQLSPQARNKDEECILIEDSPPISGTDSAKSKRGTGRKGAFAGAGSKRAGPSSKSTSPETNGASNDGMKRFLNLTPSSKKAKTKLDVGDLSESQNREMISKNEAACTQAAAASSDVEIKDEEAAKTSSEPTSVGESEGCKHLEVGSNAIKSNISGKDSSEISSKKTAGRQKAVAKVKMTSEAAGEVSKDAELQAPKPSNPTASARSATKTKESPSAEEREKRERLIRNELVMLSEMRVYGEFVPMLRPTAEELQDLEEMKEADGPLPIKLRQLISRFIEGRQQSSEGMVECLKVFLQSAPGDSETSIDFSRIESVMPTLGKYVACRPQLQSMETCDQMVDFIQRWEVKDMADIPERFRLIVDVHRKMEAAVKERMLHLFEMIKELNNGGKGLAKLERALVAMKDRYAKLEERERKEKEKLETKLDADRKKVEEARKKQEENRKKQEENRKKQEENKKKQEEKDEKSKKKDDEVRVKEKKEQGKQKEATVLKQASFMANFFKKPVSSPGDALSASGGVTEDVAAGVEDGPIHAPSMSSRSERDQEAAVKLHRNFHPWEKPKNAIVAGYPLGPGPNRNHRREANAPAETDLGSWISHWKKNPRRNDSAHTTLRDDGRPHPRMKMIQLCMMVPVTRTQLVDVDVDAVKKVIWDIEADPEEQQLQAILNEAEATSEGLYRWKGKTLQFLTEGGGWFDSRRPPYFGTWSKKSQVVNGRKPLARESELDYDYESDADWESEAGDGEELGSEVDMEDDGDEELDVDEDGGFVVPDGYSSDRDIPEAGALEVSKRNALKLQQIVYDRHCIPADVANDFAAVVLDELPLVLSNDPNTAFEHNTDFYGEDLTGCKVPSLEAALYRLHQHPIACSFTYIPPNVESKFAGHLFLKTANAPKNGSKQEGFISAYLKEVPLWKQAAIQAQAIASQNAVKDAPVVPAANIPESAAPAVAKQAPPPPVQVTEEQLQVLAKLLVHTTKRGKQELVDEYVAACTGLTKNRAFKIISQVAFKKNNRWLLSEDTISKHPAIAELAAELVKASAAATPNPVVVTVTSEPQRQEPASKAPLQQQLIFRSLTKQPPAPPAVQAQAAQEPRDASDVLEQFGCLPL